MSQISKEVVTMKNILIASLAVLLLTVGALPAFATSEIPPVVD
ncbi:hypothetical protein ES703_35953 [subsurface metagenome]